MTTIEPVASAETPKAPVPPTTAGPTANDALASLINAVLHGKNDGVAAAWLESRKG